MCKLGSVSVCPAVSFWLPLESSFCAGAAASRGAYQAVTRPTLSLPRCAMTSSIARRTSSDSTTGVDPPHQTGNCRAQHRGAALESPVVDLQAQPVAADEFVVGTARLRVLTDHVHVLEGALQEMALVDRGGASGVVDRV